MFYTKITTVQCYEIKIPLDEGIFTDCYECDKEIAVDEELLLGVLKDGDLATTKILCRDCSIKRVLSRE